MKRKEFKITDTIKTTAKEMQLFPDTTTVPDTMTFRLSEKSKEGFTLKKGERPFSEFSVDYTTENAELNAQLDALKKAQCGIMISKIDAGIALEKICGTTKNRKTPLYLEGGFKTAEEFYESIHMNRKTVSLWRCVARYVAPNGAKISAISRGLLSESAIFAGYAKNIPTVILNAIAETSDHAITSAKDLFSEYNRFIKSIDTDEPLPEKDENGNDITESEKENAVETTADTMEIEGTKYHLFSVHGNGIKKNTTVKIPESAMVNTQSLYEYAVNHAVEIVKPTAIDVKKDNNATVLNAFVGVGGSCIINIVQTTPELKVYTFVSLKTLPDTGIKEKTEPETEPENTENKESA